MQTTINPQLGFLVHENLKPAARAPFGRYSSGEKITINTGFTQEKTFHLTRRHNICPTQTVPVIPMKMGQLAEESMR